MYSVIIQNQKTMESFSKFYPLFLESIIEKKVGVCRWIESGTTIASTVPELIKLTEDKQEWRAIIVHVYDELSMAEYERNIDNPFDFEICHTQETITWNKTVPLIRLTQILGGIPTPDVEFEAKEIIDEDKEPRIVFEPKDNSAEEELHKQLTEKYFYDGKHPSEIILITIRKKIYKQKDDIKNIWQVHGEIRSSEFWKDNCYPSNCRFLFFETERQGSVVESADMFRFWTSVMMLSVNNIDPSSLQAYRLYKINIQIDKDEIKDIFQKTFNRLIGARSFINEIIHQEASRTENLDELLPDYEIKVPVVLKKQEKDSKPGVDVSLFKILVNLTEIDLLKWDKMKKTENEKTKSILKTAEQSLDQTADKIRDHLSFIESRLFKVDKYQVKDIEDKLNDIYNNVLQLQSELPRESLAYEGELKEADKKIKSKIYERIISKQAFGGYILLVILSLLLIIPAWYFFYEYSLGSIIALIISIIICIFLPFGIEASVLFFHHNKLRKTVREYKKVHDKLILQLHDCVTAYSNYMSDIATHARGSSFLRTIKKQKLLKEHSYSEKQRHLKDINHFISYIDDWSTAFYCPVVFDSSKESDIIYIDTEIPSSLNPLYTFEYRVSTPYQVPVNNTGDYLNSPVSFIDRIFIEREELYDDN